MTNKTIVDKLAKRGLRVTQRNIRLVLSNVFYTGYVIGNLVNGKLIKGKHLALIDIQTFLKANQMLNKTYNVGFQNVLKDELSLKSFLPRKKLVAPPLLLFEKTQLVL